MSKIDPSHYPAEYALILSQKNSKIHCFVSRSVKHCFVNKSLFLQNHCFARRILCKIHCFVIDVSMPGLLVSMPGILVSDSCLRGWPPGLQGWTPMIETSRPAPSGATRPASRKAGQALQCRQGQPSHLVYDKLLDLGPKARHRSVVSRTVENSGFSTKIKTKQWFSCLK